MKFKQFDINLKRQAAILLTEFQFTITLFNIGNPSSFVDSLSCYAILLFSAVFIIKTGKCKVRGSEGRGSQKEVNKNACCTCKTLSSFHMLLGKWKRWKNLFLSMKATDKKVMPMHFFFFFSVFIFQQSVSLEWRCPRRNLPLHCGLMTKTTDINLNLQLFAVCC